MSSSPAELGLPAPLPSPPVLPSDPPPDPASACVVVTEITAPVGPVTVVVVDPSAPVTLLVVSPPPLPALPAALPPALAALFAGKAAAVPIPEIPLISVLALLLPRFRYPDLEESTKR